MNEKNEKNAILQFAKENGYVFPEIYVELLSQHNGFSFGGGAILYRIDELNETNEYMQIKIYQPEYIAIGDDGGGLVFLMKQSVSAKEVIIVDMSDYNILNCYDRKDNLLDWFKDDFCIIKDDDVNEELSKKGSVMLISMPQNGLKDLILIKKSFDLNISTSELLIMTKELPCCLVDDITYAKVKKIIEKVGQIDIFKFNPK